MSRHLIDELLLPVALALTVVATSPVPAAAATRPASRIVVEAGWSRPQGDLAGGFPEEALGFGAGDALELGFRWRRFLSNSLSLSPGFHFVNYRDFKGVDAALGDFRNSSSSLLYTLEAMMMAGGDKAPIRPFVAVSGGLYRNRVTGYDKGLTAQFKESVNTFGVAARAGVHLGGFEISAMYHLNRFATWRFFPTGREQDYDWDSFTVRTAWIIPFSEAAE